MATVQTIDILRPAGNYRAFTRPATLSGQRYVLTIKPSEPLRASGWWLTLANIAGVVLVRSLRLTPQRDLIAFARNTVDGLPPGRFALTCAVDPGIDDLSVEGLVALTYEVDD